MWPIRVRVVFLLLSVTLVASANAMVLRPGLLIRISCEQEATLCVDRVVQPDGTIKLPNLGTVSVAGKNPSEASRLIALASSKTFGSLDISIRVVGAPGVPVRYIGAIERPGEVQSSAQLRLQRVIELAKPTEAADMSSIEIENAAGDQTVVDWIGTVGMNSVRNPLLRAGDTVRFVLRAHPRDVLVLGAVKQPGSMPFIAGLTVDRAMALSGGATSQADLGRLSVLRDNKALILNPGERIGAVELRAGDAVRVPYQGKLDYVYVDGAVRAPGMIPFHEGLTLTRALADAGGVLGTANLKTVDIKRVTEGSRTIHVDLSAVLRGQAPDILLKPDDSIIVPDGRSPH